MITEGRNRYQPGILLHFKYMKYIKKKKKCARVTERKKWLKAACWGEELPVLLPFIS